MRQLITSRAAPSPCHHAMKAILAELPKSIHRKEAGHELQSSQGPVRPKRALRHLRAPQTEGRFNTPLTSGLARYTPRPGTEETRLLLNGLLLTPDCCDLRSHPD